jgi:type IV pilus assembly protein PilE
MHRQHMALTSAPPRRAHRGFTLIEVMIAVVVIAILSAIAYPAYTDHIRRAKRATAQAAMMDIAAKQQTYLLDRRAYTTSTATLGFIAPAEIATDYTFTIAADNAVTPPTFTVTATPVSAAQTAGSEPTMTLNQAGAKTPASYWKR